MASPLSDSEGRAYVNRRPGLDPQAHPRVVVSLQFADPQLTAASSTALPKWYHMNRDANEPLQTSLSRLRLNIIANRVKLSKKGRKGKSGRPKAKSDEAFDSTTSAASASASALDPDALPAAAEDALAEALSSSSFKITKRGIELAPAPRSKSTEEQSARPQPNADDDAPLPSYLLGDPAHVDLRIALLQNGRAVCAHSSFLVLISCATKALLVLLLMKCITQVSLNTPSLAAWTTADTLTIGKSAYEICVDYPEVASVKWPTRCLVGLPVRPHIEWRNADPKCSQMEYSLIAPSRVPAKCRPPSTHSNAPSASASAFSALSSISISEPQSDSTASPSTPTSAALAVLRARVAERGDADRFGRWAQLEPGVFQFTPRPDWLGALVNVRITPRAADGRVGISTVCEGRYAVEAGPRLQTGAARATTEAELDQLVASSNALPTTPLQLRQRFTPQRITNPDKYEYSCGFTDFTYNTVLVLYCLNQETTDSFMYYVL